MRILTAPDKFKGSLTAVEAAEAIERGWGEVMPGAIFDRACLADGGEGTVDVFSSWDGAEMRRADVCDALGRALFAEYVWVPGERLAVIEMSAASGLAKIPESERDILRSTTFGTGQLVLDAMAQGPATVAVGLGGSATNDGGVGLASALGWRFQDRLGRDMEPTPRTLCEIAGIVPPDRRAAAKILALSDVKNPLLGARGCSRVYGPQKGATEEEIGMLELHLEHFADVCEKTFGTSHRDTPGAGAAGGLGFGLLTFCGAEILSGFDWIAGRLGLEARVAACDLVITGEGSIDSQTIEGKGPGALAALAKKHGKPCIAFAGRVEMPAPEIFSRCVSIGDPAIGLADNLARGAQSLRAAAIKVARSLSS
ncbi:MAG: glycerate kinase [Terrimicrobiaceae bacterium]